MQTAAFWFGLLQLLSYGLSPMAHCICFVKLSGAEERVQLAGNSGSFSVPADLYSGSVQLRVRSWGRERVEGATAFRAAFHKKQIELFQYTEMLIAFFLAGALATVVLFAIGLILQARALRVTAFFDMDLAELVAGGADVPRKNQAQGDHRRNVPLGRRWAAAVAGTQSRGES
ncbi:hypothetical protein HPB52_023837 [Rhipicephalus sanguineus]|uniref:Uncharacterized protein n=1 Tax=Rhipicephalus sanguineus TaxID=34632 RepID=A0A9D4PSX3_RHISA|nr:hypothetical protein HPB52_023837 [Rhipicephalus sanguineus]